MYRVTQGVPIDTRAIENIPDWRLGPGLLVILDVKESEGSPFFESDSTVRVHHPDGSFLDCEVTGVGFTEENISLFFPKLGSHDIPISSHIQLMPSVLPDPTGK